MLAVPAAVRSHYLAELERLKAQYADELRMRGIDYTLVSTATPLDAALLSYLHARSGERGRTLFGLTFLSPWFLLGALVVALPILLHLRRRDTAPAQLRSARSGSSGARAFEQRRPTKLRDLLLLALRALALSSSPSPSRARICGRRRRGADHDRGRRYVVQHGRAGRVDACARGSRPRRVARAVGLAHRGGSVRRSCGRAGAALARSGGGAGGHRQSGCWLGRHGVCGDVRRGHASRRRDRAGGSSW